MYILSADKELTDARLLQFITRHNQDVKRRYEKLLKAYKTDYPILHQKKKPKWKPDNRITVNFAKYIVDTMNGFSFGNPIKILVDAGNEEVEKYIELLDQYNDQDDNNAELSKSCLIFGRGYEMYYVDDLAMIGITYLTPMEAFMIYDDSLVRKERFFVHTYIDEDGVLHGSVSDDTVVKYFRLEGELIWEGEPKIHGFDGVPAAEYVENEECMGIFEPVMSMINAYNKAISEKANDVDYFADAYLKILGALVNDDDTKYIRSSRIINFDGIGDKNPEVDFLKKPDSDATQEHLIDRLERLIFQISMVANISDENFGTSSGIAMKYKLQAMLNLQKTKERKFVSGMNRRYRLIFSNPVSGMKKDDWLKLHYKFTPNIPANLLEETEIAKNMEGITSHETQLNVLSIVDNVRNELDKIKAEEQAAEENIVDKRMFEEVADEQS